MMRILTATMLLLVFSATGDARGTLIEIDDQELAEHLPSLIAFRHAMHANPELGNREVETAAMVAAELRSLDLEVTENIAHTGVVGVLRGPRPGPTSGTSTRCGW